MTDIATGWTEKPQRAQQGPAWVIAALEGVAQVMPLPITGVDSDHADRWVR